MDISSTTHQKIVRLHEARGSRELSQALFPFVSKILPQEVLFLVLRPLEFELPSFCSRPEFQPICNDYIAGKYTDDIWLKRSPIRPDLPIVRHSQYTPQEVFRRSLFYRDVMQKIGCEYGTSLVAWKQDLWLANLTIFRTESQGDFREEELPILQNCHLHFQSAVKRIAYLHEEKLGQSSLETFIWSLPTAALVLDWDLKLLHFNASAQELAYLWKQGPKSVKLKRPRSMVVPGDILATIEKKKQQLAEMKPNRPGSPSVIPFLEIKHSFTPGFSAKISFLPSKTLAMSKGTFLVLLHYAQAVPDERQGYDLFSSLTRRERDVVLQASSGIKSTAIAKHLGTSSITVRKQLHKAYEKLGIHSRYELMAMFSKNSLLSATLPK